MGSLTLHEVFKVSHSHTADIEDCNRPFAALLKTALKGTRENGHHISRQSSPLPLKSPQGFVGRE
jgi:hypothetical protein